MVESLQIDFLAIAPEVALLVGALSVLMVGVLRDPPARVYTLIGYATLEVAFLLALVQWADLGDGGGGLRYGGMLVYDGLGVFARFALLVVGGLGLVGAAELVERLGRRGAEFVALVLLSVSGMHLMAASADLIMIFLGLEVASISLYVVAGITRGRISADEAAMKYFLLGSFASAVFLYGIALVYAATGTTGLYEAAAFLDGTLLLRPGVLLAGVGLLLAGLGFKVSAAPFHQWAPDVYQGAPAGAVGFMAAGAKVAGFAALARVLTIGLDATRADWGPAVAVLAAISIVVGSVLAIAQTDMKRMLAYSSVAHAGFIATGLVAGTAGLAATWFYLATYGIQVAATFAIVAVMAGPTAGASPLDDYAGLSERRPLLAGLLATLMLAQAGLPLTTGFIGKIGVFQAAWDANFGWLVLVALVGAVVGLFFYLRVIVLMYMQPSMVADAPGAARAEPTPSRTVAGAVTAATVFTVVFGLIPAPLLDVIRDALGR